ncbi:MAG: SDR family oxidoreductase [Sphingobacteriaceae bacterium]|nr:MAG: SDR family oxidoreductase [Sphingobacteriaceae bacterium]
MFDLAEKNTIITGGGSGIGKAIAMLFAKQGAIIHIIELNAEAGEQTASEIENAGGKAFVYSADVSNQQQILETFMKLDKIDILINNAGIAHIGRADTTEEADFERVFNINVKGAYNCLYAAIPNMKANGGGVILNLASIAAWVGLADRFAYSMSKGAIFAMTLSVARDYLEDQIRCNSISPARIHTRFVTGCDYPLDGGFIKLNN